MQAAKNCATHLQIQISYNLIEVTNKKIDNVTVNSAKRGVCYGFEKDRND